MSINRMKVTYGRCLHRWNRVAISRLSLMFVLGSSLLAFSGCSAWTGMNNAWKYNGSWNESMMGYRMKSGANKAWHCRKHHFCNEKYMKEFSAGFKAGYTEVADGGTGCSPNFAPRDYWGWKYQSCEGQARVAAWFAGFPHGARAAEEEGVGNWTQLQTSSSIQNQYAKHGLLNSSAAGMYPIPQASVPNGSPSYVGNQNLNTRVEPTPGMPVSLGGEMIDISNSPSLIQH
jgi:hypothetical protein